MNKLEKFTEDIRNQEQFNYQVLRLLEAFDKYSVSRSMMHYSQIQNVKKELMKVYKLNNMSIDHNVTSEKSMFEQKGYHGSMKNESIKDYFTEAING